MGHCFPKFPEIFIVHSKCIITVQVLHFPVHIAVLKKVGGFAGKIKINCRKNEENISPMAKYDGNFRLLTIMPVVLAPG